MGIKYGIPMEDDNWGDSYGSIWDYMGLIWDNILLIVK